MISESDKYNAAVFVQLLDAALADEPDSIEDALEQALTAFSPEATPKQRKDYVASLCDTITDDAGELREDWQDLVIEEHAA